MEPRSAEEILLSLVHYPVTALGIGRRIGIWLQGCTRRCPGCISRHAWSTAGAERTSVAALLELIDPWLDHCDGITISGGEPFDQPEPLSRLVRELRKRGARDLMLYSGHTIEALRRDHPAILDSLDALVDGEFRLGNATSAAWKGSDNQQLHILSRNPALRSDYARYADERTGRPRLQVVGKTGRIFVIGIPRQADAEMIIHGTC